MRLAVISDIHANKEALDEVIHSVEDRSVERLVCIGDLVNYGIDFSYCIDLVKERTDVCVMGNHDATVIGRHPLHEMNREARNSARWTMDRLTGEEKIFLESLGFVHTLNGMLFVHATPDAPERWSYITNWFDAESQFDNFDDRFCFVGHSHIPGIFDSKRSGNLYEEGVLSLKPGSRYIVNVGSVGQPRDRDPRACYVIVDEEDETVEFVRLDYDMEETSRKIASTGVSKFNALRILEGI